MTRKTLYLLVVVVVLAFPSSAGAVAIVNPDGSRAEPYSTWADTSKVPTREGVVTVDFDMTRCGGLADTALACYRPWERGLSFKNRCEIKNVDDLRLCRFTTRHELGHDFAETMPAWKMKVFARVVGISVDNTQISEVFADAYALCADGRATFDTPGVSVFTTTRRQHRRICKLVRQPN